MAAPHPRTRSTRHPAFFEFETLAPLAATRGLKPAPAPAIWNLTPADLGFLADMLIDRSNRSLIPDLSRIFSIEWHKYRPIDFGLPASIPKWRDPISSSADSTDGSLPIDEWLDPQERRAQAREGELAFKHLVQDEYRHYRWLHWIAVTNPYAVLTDSAPMAPEERAKLHLEASIRFNYQTDFPKSLWSIGYYYWSKPRQNRLDATTDMPNFQAALTEWSAQIFKMPTDWPGVVTSQSRGRDYTGDSGDREPRYYARLNWRLPLQRNWVIRDDSPESLLTRRGIFADIRVYWAHGSEFEDQRPSAYNANRRRLGPGEYGVPLISTSASADHYHPHALAQAHVEEGPPGPGGPLKYRHYYPSRYDLQWSGIDPEYSAAEDDFFCRPHERFRGCRRWSEMRAAIYRHYRETARLKRSHYVLNDPGVRLGDPINLVKRFPFPLPRAGTVDALSGRSIEARHRMTPHWYGHTQLGADPSAIIASAASFGQNEKATDHRRRRKWTHAHPDSKDRLMPPMLFHDHFNGTWYQEYERVEHSGMPYLRRPKNLRDPINDPPFPSDPGERSLDAKCWPPGRFMRPWRPMDADYWFRQAHRMSAVARETRNNKLHALDRIQCAHLEDLAVLESLGPDANDKWDPANPTELGHHPSASEQIDWVVCFPVDSYHRLIVEVIPDPVVGGRDVDFPASEALYFADTDIRPEELVVPEDGKKRHWSPYRKSRRKKTTAMQNLESIAALAQLEPILAELKNMTGELKSIEGKLKDGEYAAKKAERDKAKAEKEKKEKEEKRKKEREKMLASMPHVKEKVDFTIGGGIGGPPVPMDHRRRPAPPDSADEEGLTISGSPVENVHSVEDLGVGPYESSVYSQGSPYSGYVSQDGYHGKHGSRTRTSFVSGDGYDRDSGYGADRPEYDGDRRSVYYPDDDDRRRNDRSAAYGYNDRSDQERSSYDGDDRRSDQERGFYNDNDRRSDQERRFYDDDDRRSDRFSDDRRSDQEGDSYDGDSVRDDMNERREGFTDGSDRDMDERDGDMDERDGDMDERDGDFEDRDIADESMGSGRSEEGEEIRSEDGMASGEGDELSGNDDLSGTERESITDEEAGEPDGPGEDTEAELAASEIDREDELESEGDDISQGSRVSGSVTEGSDAEVEGGGDEGPGDETDSGLDRAESGPEGESSSGEEAAGEEEEEEEGGGGEDLEGSDGEIGEESTVEGSAEGATEDGSESGLEASEAGDEVASAEGESVPELEDTDAEEPGEDGSEVEGSSGSVTASDGDAEEAMDTATESGEGLEEGEEDDDDGETVTGTGGADEEVDSLSDDDDAAEAGAALPTERTLASTGTLEPGDRIEEWVDNVDPDGDPGVTSPGSRQNVGDSGGETDTGSDLGESESSGTSAPSASEMEHSAPAISVSTAGVEAQSERSLTEATLSDDSVDETSPHLVADRARSQAEQSDPFVTSEVAAAPVAAVDRGLESDEEQDAIVVDEDGVPLVDESVVPTSLTEYLASVPDPQWVEPHRHVGELAADKVQTMPQSERDPAIREFESLLDTFGEQFEDPADEARRSDLVDEPEWLRCATWWYRRATRELDLLRDILARPELERASAEPDDVSVDDRPVDDSASESDDSLARLQSKLDAGSDDLTTVTGLTSNDSSAYILQKTIRAEPRRVSISSSGVSGRRLSQLQREIDAGPEDLVTPTVTASSVTREHGDSDIVEVHEILSREPGDRSRSDGSEIRPRVVLSREDAERITSEATVDSPTPLPSGYGTERTRSDRPGDERTRPREFDGRSDGQDSTSEWTDSGSVAADSEQSAGSRDHHRDRTVTGSPQSDSDGAGPRGEKSGSGSDSDRTVTRAPRSTRDTEVTLTDETVSAVKAAAGEAAERRDEREGLKRRRIDLQQAHVDLLKALWILTEWLHDRLELPARPYTVPLTTGQALLSRILDRICWMGFNGLLPNGDASDRPFDLTIWIPYPELQGLADLEAVLNGRLASDEAETEHRAKVDHLQAVPLDTPGNLQMFVNVKVIQRGGYVLLADDGSELTIPCLFSVMRDTEHYRTSLALWSQRDQVNIRISPDDQHLDDEEWHVWNEFTWLPDHSSTRLRLTAMYTLSIQFEKSDYTIIRNLVDQTPALDHAFQPRPNERVVLTTQLIAGQYEPEGQQGIRFPAGPLRDCHLLVFERTRVREVGVVAVELHRGYRIALVSLQLATHDIYVVSFGFRKGAPIVYQKHDEKGTTGDRGAVERRSVGQEDDHVTEDGTEDDHVTEDGTEDETATATLSTGGTDQSGGRESRTTDDGDEHSDSQVSEETGGDATTNRRAHGSRSGKGGEARFSSGDHSGRKGTGRGTETDMTRTDGTEDESDWVDETSDGGDSETDEPGRGQRTATTGPDVSPSADRYGVRLFALPEGRRKWMFFQFDGESPYKKFCNFLSGMDKREDEHQLPRPLQLVSYTVESAITTIEPQRIHYQWPREPGLPLGAGDGSITFINRTVRTGPHMPVTLLSDRLRMVMNNFDGGTFIDRMMLEPDELLIRLPATRESRLSVLRRPQSTYSTMLSVERLLSERPDERFPISELLRRTATLRRYEFHNDPDLHEFQRAMTGHEVRFDAMCPRLVICNSKPARRVLPRLLHRTGDDVATRVRIQVVVDQNDASFEAAVTEVAVPLTPLEGEDPSLTMQPAVERPAFVKILCFFDSFEYADALVLHVKASDAAFAQEVDKSGYRSVKLMGAQFKQPPKAVREAPPVHQQQFRGQSGYFDDATPSTAVTDTDTERREDVPGAGAGAIDETADAGPYDDGDGDDPWSAQRGVRHDLRRRYVNLDGRRDLDDSKDVEIQFSDERDFRDFCRALPAQPNPAGGKAGHGGFLGLATHGRVTTTGLMASGGGGTTGFATRDGGFQNTESGRGSKERRNGNWRTSRGPDVDDYY